MTSNIHSHRHLMGPAVVAGARGEIQRPTLKMEFLHHGFSTLISGLTGKI